MNDTSGDAALLRLDDKSLLIEDLNIHNDRDEDWFRFTLPEGITSSSGIKIQFDNAEGDLDLELYEIISDSSLVSIDQSTGTTDEESISFDGLSEVVMQPKSLHTVETQVITVLQLIFHQQHYQRTTSKTMTTSMMRIT